MYPQYYVFNPSVLSLSVLENSNATLVVVARGEYSYLTTDEDDVYQPRDLIAGLFEDTYNNELYRESRFYPPNEPDITAFSEQILDELMLSADIYIPKCNVKEYKWYRNIQGPENGRLFWTQLGEPLVYLSNSPENCDLCRTLYLVDLRSVYPPLANLLGTDSRFNRSVPLLYPGQTGFHKNWAVFTTWHGDILIHTDLVPQRI